MPTFNSYVEKEGYYIKARPSGVGNVTYQIKPRAESFICDLGYADGDELPWEIIKWLRVAGLVYTNNQGVEVESGDITDLDSERLPELSEAEAEKLLSFLEQHGDIPESVLEQLQLQVSPDPYLDELLEMKTEDASWVVTSENAIANAVYNEVGTDVSVDIFSEQKTSTLFESERSRTSHYIRITMNVSEDRISEKKIEHKLCMSSGIDEWSISHPYENTWAGIAKAYETKPSVLRALSKIINDLPFNIELYIYDDNSIIV